MMHTGTGIFFSVSAIILFVLSFLQFREKGFLLNNAYIWASKKERKKWMQTKRQNAPITVNRATHFCFLEFPLQPMRYTAF